MDSFTKTVTKTNQQCASTTACSSLEYEQRHTSTFVAAKQKKAPSVINSQNSPIKPKNTHKKKSQTSSKNYYIDPYAQTSRLTDQPNFISKLNFISRIENHTIPEPNYSLSHSEDPHVYTFQKYRSISHPENTQIPITKTQIVFDHTKSCYLSDFQDCTCPELLEYYRDDLSHIETSSLDRTSFLPKTLFKKHIKYEFDPYEFSDYSSSSENVTPYPSSYEYSPTNFFEPLKRETTNNSCFIAQSFILSQPNTPPPLVHSISDQSLDLTFIEPIPSLPIEDYEISIENSSPLFSYYEQPPSYHSSNPPSYEPQLFGPSPPDSNEIDPYEESSFIRLLEDPEDIIDRLIADPYWRTDDPDSSTFGISELPDDWPYVVRRGSPIHPSQMLDEHSIHWTVPSRSSTLSDISSIVFEEDNLPSNYININQSQYQSSDVEDDLETSHNQRASTSSFISIITDSCPSPVDSDDDRFDMPAFASYERWQYLVRKRRCFIRKAKSEDYYVTCREEQPSLRGLTSNYNVYRFPIRISLQLEKIHCHLDDNDQPVVGRYDPVDQLRHAYHYRPRALNAGDQVYIPGWKNMTFFLRFSISTPGEAYHQLARIYHEFPEDFHDQLTLLAEDEHKLRVREVMSHMDKLGIVPNLTYSGGDFIVVPLEHSVARHWYHNCRHNAEITGHQFAVPQRRKLVTLDLDFPHVRPYFSYQHTGEPHVKHSLFDLPLYPGEAGDTAIMYDDVLYADISSFDSFYNVVHTPCKELVVFLNIDKDYIDEYIYPNLFEYEFTRPLGEIRRPAQPEPSVFQQAHFQEAPRRVGERNPFVAQMGGENTLTADESAHSYLRLVVPEIDYRRFNGTLCSCHHIINAYPILFNRFFVRSHTNYIKNNAYNYHDHHEYYHQHFHQYHSTMSCCQPQLPDEGYSAQMGDTPSKHKSASKPNSSGHHNCICNDIHNINLNVRDIIKNQHTIHEAISIASTTITKLQNSIAQTNQNSFNDIMSKLKTLEARVIEFEYEMVCRDLESETSETFEAQSSPPGDPEAEFYELLLSHPPFEALQILIDKHFPSLSEAFLLETSSNITSPYVAEGGEEYSKQGFIFYKSLLENQNQPIKMAFTILMSYEKSQFELALKRFTCSIKQHPNLVPQVLKKLDRLVPGNHADRFRWTQLYNAVQRTRVDKYIAQNGLKSLWNLPSRVGEGIDTLGRFCNVFESIERTLLGVQLPAALDALRMFIVNFILALYIMSTTTQPSIRIAACGCLLNMIPISLYKKIGSSFASSIMTVSMQIYETFFAKEFHAQVDSPDEEFLLTSVVKVIGDFIKPSSPSTCKMEDFRVKRLFNVSKTIKSCSNIIEYLESLFVDIKTFVVKHLYNVDDLDELYNAIDKRIPLWLKEVTRFELYVDEKGRVTGPSIMLSEHEERIKMCRLMHEGNMIVKQVSAIHDHNSPALMYINSRLKRLDEIVKASAAAMVGVRGKHEPVLIYIVGRPGIGKSLMVDYLAGAVYACFDERYDHAIDKFSKSDTSEFWDGYAMQKVYLIDDFFQVRDVDMRTETLGAIIDIGSRAPFPLNMAHLENKGLAYFNSDMVILTSNTWPAENTLMEHIIDPEAFYRRVDIKLDVQVKTAYCTKKGGIKPEIMRQCKGFNPEILEFTITNNLGETVKYNSWNELVLAIAAIRARKLCKERILDTEMENISHNSNLTAFQNYLSIHDIETHNSLYPSIKEEEYWEGEVEVDVQSQVTDFFSAANEEYEAQMWLSKVKNYLFPEDRNKNCADYYALASLQDLPAHGHTKYVTFFHQFLDGEIEANHETLKVVEEFPPAYSGPLKYMIQKEMHNYQLSFTQRLLLEYKSNFTNGCIMPVLSLISTAISAFAMYRWMYPAKQSRILLPEECVAEGDTFEQTVTHKRKPKAFKYYSEDAPVQSPEQVVAKDHVYPVTPEPLCGFETESRTPVRHEHTCEKCHKLYSHEHTLFKLDHKQFPYQCPNEECVWYYKKDPNNVYHKNLSKSVLVETEAELSIEKVKKINETPGFIDEAARDQNLNDMMAAVSGNCCIIYNTKYRTHVCGLFICRGIFIFPSHLLAFTPEDELGDVELRLESPALIHSFTLKQYGYVWYEDADIVAVNFPATVIPPRRDITKCFVNDNDLLGRYDAGYLLRRDDTSLHSLWRIMVSDIVLGSRMEYNVNLNGMSEVIHVVKHCKYVSDTSKGDCGAPLFLQHSGITRKLLGFHVAGNVGHGVANVITNSVIATIISKFPFDAQFFVEYPNLEPFQEGLLTFSDNVEIVGKIPDELQYRQGLKTKIIESPIFDMVRTHTTLPCMLRRTNGIDPLRNGIEKAFAPDIHINSRLVDVVVEDLSRCINSYKSAYKGKGLVEDFVNLNGIAGDPWICAINYKSSAGYPYVLIDHVNGKRSLVEGDCGEFTLRPIVREAVERRIAKARKGIVQCTIFSDCKKDERRPIAKVQSGKTRIFSCGPFDLTVAVRRYFLNFIAHVMDNHTFGEVSIGINPHSDSWGNFYIQLKSKGHYWIAGDYEAYDKRLPYQILMASIEVVNNFYNDGPENANIRRVLGVTMFSSFRLADKIVYRNHHGMPSGVPVTSIFNSIANCLLFRIAFIEISKSLNFDKIFPFFRFHEFIAMRAYGDDHILRVHEKCEWFNMQSVSQYFATIGLGYTTNSKVGVVEKFVSDSDLQYLKRKFINRQGRTCAPLDMDSIYEMLNWLHYCKDTHEALLFNVRAVCLEMTHYSKGEWDRMHKQIAQVCAQKGIYIPVYTYQDCLQMLNTDFGLGVNLLNDETLQSLGNAAAEWADVEEDFVFQQKACATINKGKEYLEAQSGVAPSGNTNTANSLKTDIVDANQIPVQTEGLTEFHDTAPPVTEDNVHSLDLWSKLLVYPEQDLKQILERPYLIQNFKWTTGSASHLTSLSMPFDLFKNENIYKKLGYFRYFRAKAVELTFRLNATAFHYGRLLVSYIPCAGRDNLGNATVTRNHSDLISHTSMPHICISPTAGKPFTLTIPWTCPKPYMDFGSLNSANQDNQGWSMEYALTEMAQVFVWVLNPLGGMPPVAPVDISVFAKFVDVQLGAYTDVFYDLRIIATKKYAMKDQTGRYQIYTGPFDKVPRIAYEAQSGEGKKKSEAGVVSTTLNYASRIAGYFTRVPILGTFALPAYALTGAASVVAQWLGWDKPIDQSISKPIQMKYQNLSISRGLESSTMLGVDIENSVGDTLGLMGSKKEDLFLHGIISRPGLIDRVTITSAMTNGTTLATYAVSPLCVSGFKVGTTKQFICHTPLSFTAACFQYWRGTMIYHLQFIASPMHSMRVRIAWIPGYEHPGDVTMHGGSDLISDVIDIKGDTMYDVAVPFNSDLLYLSNFCELQSTATPKYIHTLPVNGWLHISVVNYLNYMQTPVPNIYMNVWVSGATDFQFAKPTCARLREKLVPAQNVEEEPIDKNAFIAQSGEENVSYRGDTATSIFNTTSCVPHNICFGEEVVHIKDLIMRPGPVAYCNVSVDTGATFIYKPWSRNNQDTQQNLSFMRYFMQIFKYWKGSVHVKCIRDKSVSSVITAGTLPMRTQDTSTMAHSNPLSLTAGFNIVNGTYPLGVYSEGCHTYPADQLALPEFTLPYYNNLSHIVITDDKPTQLRGGSLLFLAVHDKCIFYLMESAGDDFQYGFPVGAPCVEWPIEIYDFIGMQPDFYSN